MCPLPSFIYELRLRRQHDAVAAVRCVRLALQLYYAEPTTPHTLVFPKTRYKYNCSVLVSGHTRKYRKDASGGSKSRRVNHGQVRQPPVTTRLSPSALTLQYSTLLELAELRLDLRSNGSRRNEPGCSNRAIGIVRLVESKHTSVQSAGTRSTADWPPKRLGRRDLLLQQPCPENRTCHHHRPRRTRRWRAESGPRDGPSARRSGTVRCHTEAERG